MTPIDLPAAVSFLATHARNLDRRRFQLLMGETDAAAVLAAVEGYRNPDGGYGWGLEPDLRSPGSQPGAALHAFETFAEVAPVTSAHATALCDWLDSVSLPDGGLPFALPSADTAGNAPWWAHADATTSSLQITAAVLANAHRLAAHDHAVAAHPWLHRATAYCLSAIEGIDAAPQAYVLAFAVRFLDTVHGTHREAPDLLAGLRTYIPADGLLHVEGGTEVETLRPLDFTPVPRPASARPVHPGSDRRKPRLPGRAAARRRRLGRRLRQDLTRRRPGMARLRHSPCHRDPAGQQEDLMIIRSAPPGRGPDDR